ncbi:hypothetical protein [Streptomyces daliensis]|uniref:Uncharacterized protein n=1 Tax=Streptomyces daliensis TaxID=299421 RepID=A0A8T4IJG3_9ACTN|nr:hypothetical protein [Streptomyces daliensis]
MDNAPARSRDEQPLHVPEQHFAQLTDAYWLDSPIYGMQARSWARQGRSAWRPPDRGGQNMADDGSAASA